MDLNSQIKDTFPWMNERSFIRSIDSLPTGQKWKTSSFSFSGDRGTEEVELWHRDPIDCVRELISNPLFRDSMRYAPERVWFAGRRRVRKRVYGEMWTGDWWWKTQVSTRW